VLTAGVDLAAENKGTALALIEWSSSGAALVELELGVADQRIAETATIVEKLGIDCAFGWPDQFVRFVADHAAGLPLDADGGMDWRRTLAFRATDRRVRELTGRWPLSVSTDRLGLTAMRCAALLARIAERGVTIDRAGSGVAVEVYPGASLRNWGFDTTGYRVDSAVRAGLLESLRDEAPWLQIPDDHAALMAVSGDAFDAVVAALAARSAATGRSITPTADELPRARREGWIALPTGPLADLVGADGSD
jgi:hypothetical protein